MRTVLLPFLVLAVTPPDARSQEAIGSNERVRVTASEAYGTAGTARTLTGRLLAFDEETITLQVDGEASASRVPRTAIERVEIPGRKMSRGHAIKRGAGIGFLGGAAAGVLVGFASGDDQCDEGAYLNFCNLAFSAEQKAVMAAIVMGGLGAIVGGAIGAGRNLEEWYEIDKGALRMSAGPRRGGVGVSLSLRF